MLKTNEKSIASLAVFNT